MAAYDFEVAVVGGGSAGYAAARTLAAGGVKVAVVDGAPELGGLCILRGCMPTKALLHAAELRQAIDAGAEWGLKLVGEPNFRGDPTTASVVVDLKRMAQKKDQLIAGFAKYRQDQLADGRFTLIRTNAQFSDPHTLQLASGGTLTAAHFVLATGSRVAPLPFKGTEGRTLLDSDSALKLTGLPADLIMLGGGAVACEFAQFYARLGVKVTQLQRSPQLLKGFDADVAQELATAFAREGIRLHLPAQVEEVGILMGRYELKVRLSGAERTKDFYGKQIFNAYGRKPNTGGLNLAAAGVELLPSGHIRTDLHQRTSAGHIFAGGDCCGPHEIVHLAIQQGEVAARTILHPRAAAPMDYRLLTSVVFTDPQVAMVGLSERVARAGGIPYLTAKYPFNDHGKSMIQGAREGFVKLLAAPGTGEILGAAAVGPQAGELIHELVVAMAGRMTVAQFAAIPHYHPTLAEIWTYPAEELADQITAPRPPPPA